MKLCKKTDWRKNVGEVDRNFPRWKPEAEGHRRCKEWHTSREIRKNHHSSQDSSVNIVTVIQAGRPWNRGSMGTGNYPRIQLPVSAANHLSLHSAWELIIHGATPPQPPPPHTCHHHLMDFQSGCASPNPSLPQHFGLRQPRCSSYRLGPTFLLCRALGKDKGKVGPITCPWRIGRGG